MRLEVRKYLYDIQEATGLISQFTAAKSLDDYERDPMMRLAVERAFAIIGEALVQLGRIDPAITAGITDLRSIIAFRNILIHAYAQIDNRIVWEIVEWKLPVLIREISALSSGEENPEVD